VTANRSSSGRMRLIRLGKRIREGVGKGGLGRDHGKPPARSAIPTSRRDGADRDDKGHEGFRLFDCVRFQHTELRQRTTGTAAGEVQARAMDRPRMVPLATSSRNGSDPKDTGRPLSHGTWCSVASIQTLGQVVAGAADRAGVWTGFCTEVAAAHRIGNDRAAISC
jgi:hypothetical protein